MSITIDDGLASPVDCGDDGTWYGLQPRSPVPQIDEMLRQSAEFFMRRFNPPERVSRIIRDYSPAIPEHRWEDDGGAHG